MTGVIIDCQCGLRHKRQDGKNTAKGQGTMRDERASYFWHGVLTIKILGGSDLTRQSGLECLCWPRTPHFEVDPKKTPVISNRKIQTGGLQTGCGARFAGVPGTGLMGIKLSSDARSLRHSVQVGQNGRKKVGPDPLACDE